MDSYSDEIIVQSTHQATERRTLRKMEIGIPKSLKMS